MTVRSTVLFRPDGKPTPLMLSLLRRKGATSGLQPLPILQGREANAFFRSWWRAEMSAYRQLPQEPIADAQGRGTDAFWELLG